MELLYESYISIIGDVLKRSQPRRIGKNVRLSEAARGKGWGIGRIGGEEI